MKRKIDHSELIINSDNSIYHLNLQPHQIAHNIIVVGDPGRVKMISKHFDQIEHEVHNREFITHTGLYNGTRISALATGIGTDNIDIVLNELDALVNIDFESRSIKKEHTNLNIVRIGTSGALQKDIEIDQMLMAEMGVGFDGLLHYYQDANKAIEKEISTAFIKHMDWSEALAKPYFTKASPILLSKAGHRFLKGITATAPGFYGPQGRQLRLQPQIENYNQRLSDFRYNGMRISNFEMETSALYGLSKLLGHNALTICAIVANRIQGKFSKNYQVVINKIILEVLDMLSSD